MTDRQWRALQGALHEYGEDTDLAGPSPRVERMLREARLRSSAATAQRTRPVLANWRWAAAACVLILSGLAAGLLIQSRPGTGRVAGGGAREVVEYSPWFVNRGLPPIERGRLARVRVSGRTLSSFGVPVPVNPTSTVDAQVFVGEDGLTRAIRFVQ